MRNFLSTVFIILTVAFCIELIWYKPKFKKEIPPTLIKDTVCLNATINYRIDSMYKLEEYKFITVTLTKFKKDSINKYNVEIISDKFRIQRLYYKTNMMSYVYLYKITPLIQGQYKITVKVSKSECETLITQDVSIK